MLTHWVRDRAREGRMGLEEVVHGQTRATAAMYGFMDRGLLKPGYKADVNVIDFSNLHLRAPEVVYDLPTEARRLVQRADGYLTTIASGEPILENGVPTGALPGKLVRGAR
ncbi:MAG: amidohydrolase family protein, partial [Myxococcales bacterium]|nr:amidohydrolase family protein [Myxococcales bacterium]